MYLMQWLLTCFFIMVAIHLHALPEAVIDQTPDDIIRTQIVNTAMEYQGTEYSYGGMMDRGFDCSGFVRYIYGKYGISLPRKSADQYQRGTRVPFKNAKHGDLVFFNIYGSRVSHVGIYLGDYRFIHSPREGKRVSISQLTDEYWKTRFVGIVCYLKACSE